MSALTQADACDVERGDLILDFTEQFELVPEAVRRVQGRGRRSASDDPAAAPALQPRVCDAAGRPGKRREIRVRLAAGTATDTRKRN